MKKNEAKRASYALAMTMLKEAVERDCPLQAITIAESILTDRIASTLNAGKETPRLPVSIGAALSRWNRKDKEESDDPRFDGEMAALRPALAKWKESRNALLHGIAKSLQGKEPTASADGFREHARKTALDGLEYVKIVKRWSQRKIRDAVKAGNTDSQTTGI